MRPGLAMSPVVSVPQSISLRPDALLLQWAEGTSTLVSASALRAACLCAPCRAAAKQHEPVQDIGSIRLRGAAPVGQYALQLFFTDGHERGIYPWRLLQELGARR